MSENQQLQGTPCAAWRAEGQPDPHGDRYNCERAALAMGDLTDDQLANAVFMHGNETPNFTDVIAGKAHMPIAYLTAAKDRIRWLSRKLEESQAASPALEAVLVGKREAMQGIIPTTELDFLETALGMPLEQAPFSNQYALWLINSAREMQDIITAQQAAVPVAIVDCSDDACWADILDDVTVKVGQKLYAHPAAPQQGVVMPESEGSAAQKSFWAGFEAATMSKSSNIREAWNRYKATDEFARLNADRSAPGEKP